MNNYQVKKLYQRGPEMEVGAFKNKEEAAQFAYKELEKDAAMKVSAIYRIYFLDEELISELNQDTLQKYMTEAPEDFSSATQAGSTSSFRPSPLQTAPRPAGVPYSSLKDDDKDKG